MARCGWRRLPPFVRQPGNLPAPAGLAKEFVVLPVLGAQGLPRGARVRVKLGTVDEVALDVAGTVIERLDAEAAPVEEEADEDETLAAGNGFYVALGPLKKGRYTLNFGGILPELSQAVTYTLDVE